MFKKAQIFLLLAVLIFPNLKSVFAVESGDENEGKADMLESKLAQQKVAEEKLPVEIQMWKKIEQEKPRPVLPEGKVHVKEIMVVGITVLSPKQIRDIIGSFYNRDLSGKEMQRCSDQITDWYNLNGFITSYAYVEPDRLNDGGILKIKCVEGKVGEVKIKGNRYFSGNVYRDRIELKEGDVFNIKLLKNNVYRTNRHPDRKVVTEVESAGSLAATDITISVKDKPPYHYILDQDNYGSEYILYKRFKNTFTFNNFTGHDDVLALKAQFAQADAHRLFDLDYFLPLNNNWKWELYIMPKKRENYYYSDNEVSDFEKRAYKWYTYLYQTVINEPNRELVFNYGFVQKFIHWYVHKQQKKQDLFCALLWGFDFVWSDDYGTWVLSEDLEKGIPRMFGASTAEDEWCSVKGAGGKYFKHEIAIARRQKLIWGADFLMKIQGQYSDQAMTGVNVFSVGGYMGTTDNRGYPRAQMPMDSGYYLMGAVSIPPYFLPKSATIPFSKGTFYDNLKFFTFVEYAKGYKRSPQSAGDKAGDTTPDSGGPSDDDRRKSLASAGCGFQFSIPGQGLSTRLDVGWPLNHKLPKDNDHCHLWYRITKSF